MATGDDVRELAVVLLKVTEEPGCRPSCHDGGQGLLRLREAVDAGAQ
jgi:hypothetical protein